MIKVNLMNINIFKPMKIKWNTKSTKINILKSQSANQEIQDDFTENK